VNANLEA
jgi:hypothetical protein